MGVEFKAGDAPEVTGVVGKKGQAVRERRRTNENIEIRNNFPSPSQERPHLGKLLHNRVGQRQKGEGGEKLAEGGQVRLWIGEGIGNLVDFLNAHVTDGNSAKIKLRMSGNGLRSSGENVNDPTRVQEVVHRWLWPDGWPGALPPPGGNPLRYVIPRKVCPAANCRPGLRKCCLPCRRDG